MMCTNEYRFQFRPILLHFILFGTVVNQYYYLRSFVFTKYNIRFLLLSICSSVYSSILIVGRLFNRDKGIFEEPPNYAMEIIIWPKFLWMEWISVQTQPMTTLGSPLWYTNACVLLLLLHVLHWILHWIENLLSISHGDLIACVRSIYCLQNLNFRRMLTPSISQLLNLT